MFYRLGYAEFFPMQRNQFDRALQELQVTLNIARRNSLEDENDTWVLFSDQHLDVVHARSFGQNRRL